MRRIATCFLALMTVGTALSSTGSGLQIEPSRTRVGLARVHLVVSDLQEVDEKLVGSYRIRIPLAPWMDDRGSLEFDLDDSLEQAIQPGVELTGQGHSDLDHRTHTIRCVFDSDTSVRIRVDTGDRILDFRARWTRGS